MSTKRVELPVGSLFRMNEKPYILVAVQWFVGSTLRGHYTTMVRISATPDSQWVEYDDDLAPRLVDGWTINQRGLAARGHCRALLLRRFAESDVAKFEAAGAVSAQKRKEGSRKSKRR